jgi:hypothetical protein
VKPQELQQVITRYVEEFAERRLQRLEKLRLRQILRRKNPYLYKAIGSHKANEIVENILRAYLSSSDEGIFGNTFFEPIAKAVSGGHVSPSEGVDIAIETDEKYLAISVKSGPNPYNSSQKRKQHQDFQALRSRVLKLKKPFDALLGHCYGRTSGEPSKTQIYRVRSGQRFWQELTGDPDFYQKLIRMMNEEIITKHKLEYETRWQHAVNRYVREFTNDFCDERGAIDWEAIVRFNSGFDNGGKRGRKSNKSGIPNSRGRRSRSGKT